MIGGKPVRTTVSDKAAPCPLDRVNRQFRAPVPNMLWVSDFTYVATWAGFVYVAFVIDTYARRIVGWRASRSAHAGFVLDVLDRALHDRRPARCWPRAVSGISCAGGRIERYAAMALMKRSPKMTANCALAMAHSRGGIFHSFSERFKIR